MDHLLVCLIVLARAVHPDYPLIVLAHRDEFTARPSQPLHWWPDKDILAGRDEQAGGSWLGLSRQGRFAAVTNVREGLPEACTRSRGELVTNWLDSLGSGLEAGQEFELESAARQLAQGGKYSGFNLLFGDWQAGQLRLHFASNRFPGRPVPTGISALSNGDFDAPWPKARRARQRLHELLASGTAPDETWLDALADRTQATDNELPDTGVGLERERWLSPLLITGPHYGTRAATLLTVDRFGRAVVIERTLVPAEGGRISGVVRQTVDLA